MAQDIPRGLEDRVAYDQWRDPQPESRRWQLTDPSVPEDAIPDWTLHRTRRIPAPDAPLLIRTIWVRETGSTDPLLLVDVHVAGSPQAARGLALRRLGDFQSPRVERRSGEGAGEVAFGDGSPNWIVFVRGNLVVHVRNGGAEVVPVLDAATAVDAALMRQTEGGEPPG